MNDYPIILLTACIDPGKILFTKRNDPLTRLEDYKKALEQWLSKSIATSIVFCENSGYDLSCLRKVPSHNKKVEFLSFDGQGFSSHLGKGYGEMRIVSYALSNSELIASNNRIIKVTGRYYIRNINRIIKGITQRKHVDIFCDLRQNLRSADSRVFGATKSFMEKYLIILQDEINDSQGMHFEIVLSKATLRAIADGLTWELLPYAHMMRGIAGTSDMELPGSFGNYFKREFFLKLKSFVMKR